MALNRNYLGHDREFRNAPGNSNTFTTDAFTVPDDGSLLVVFVAAMTHNLTGDFTSEVTVSDSQGLTWSQVVAAAGTTAYARYVTAFVADGADAGNITLSVDTGSRNMRAYFVWVFSYTGHDPSDPVGAVGSAAPLWSSGSSPDDVTLDLSSAPDASSEVLVTKHTDIGVDVTQDHLVGTEIYDDGSANSGYGSVSVLVQTESTNQSGLGWTVTPNSTPPAWATGSVIAGVEILAAPTGGTPTAPSDFLAAYPFDEGSGTSAADVSGTHGAFDLTDPGASWVPGEFSVFGNAVQLQNVESVGAAFSPNIDLSSGYTVTFWFRVSFPAVNQELLRTGPSAGPWNALVFEPWGDNQMYLGHQDSGGTYRQVAAGNYTGNVWRFFAVTWNSDTDTVQAWVGDLATPVSSAGTTSGGGGPGVVSEVCYIGGNPGQNEVNIVSGFLDELTFFDRVLSQAELDALRVEGIPTGGLNLVKVQDESAQLSQVSAIRRGLTRPQAETVQTSEGQLTLRALVRLHDDSEQVSEDDLRLLAILRLQSESVQSVEQMVRARDRTRLQAETEQPSEQMVAARGRIRVQAETEQPSEQSARARDRLRLETESEQISEQDLTVRGMVKLHGDSVQLSELDLRFLVSAIQAIIVVEDESTQISEQNLNFLRILRMVSEQAELSETSLTLRDLIRIAAEAAEVSEVDLRLRALVRQDDDSIQLGEVDIRYRDRTLIEDESVESGEDDTAHRDRLRQHGESVESGEVTTAHRDRLRQHNESIQTGDAELRFRGIFRLQEEDIESSESDLTIRGIFRLQDESVDLSEELLKFRGLTRIESVTVSLSEEDIRTRSLTRLESENVESDEDSIRFRRMIRVNDEDIEITGQIFRTRDMIRFQDEIVDLVEGFINQVGIVRIFNGSIQIVDENLERIAAIVFRREFHGRRTASREASGTRGEGTEVTPRRSEGKEVTPR